MTLAKIEGQPLATVEGAREYLFSSFRQFQSIVGSEERSKRYLGIAIHCIEQVPRLLECPRSSFRNALIEAARLDLEPNSVQQLCWIIPRAEKKGGRPTARLEVGYRGLAQLVMRDGAVKSVWTMAVDEADEFIRTEGTDRVLIHNLANKFHDGSVETMVAAYACAKLHNDEVMYRIMDREELEAARKLSRSSAYDGPFAMEMYLKTPLKRLCKLLPLSSPEIARDVAATARLEDELEGVVPDHEEPQPPKIEVIEIQKEEALPQETRDEVNQRIEQTWGELADMDACPQLTKRGWQWYLTPDCEDDLAVEFADYLKRKLLDAERENRAKR